MATRSAPGWTGLPGRVSISAHRRGAGDAAAIWLARLSDIARRRHGYFSIALSPDEAWRPVYERLGRVPYREGVHWPSWYVFFTTAPVGGTRRRRGGRLGLPGATALLGDVALDPDRICVMVGEADDPREAADGYAELLASMLLEGPHGAPRLDCILLDLGGGGHTAGLAGPAARLRHVWVAPGRDRWGGPA